MTRVKCAACKNMSDFSNSLGGFPQGEDVFQIIYCSCCGAKLMVVTMKQGFSVEEKSLVSTVMNTGIRPHVPPKPEPCPPAAPTRGKSR